MSPRGRHVAALGVLLGLAGPAAGQDAPPGGTVVGTILDAATGTPLSGAVVLLEPRPGGVVRVARGAWGSGLTQVTDADGGYRFARLALGEYRLVARRLGYRPAVVEVDLRASDALRLSVGLTVQPILLEPAEVRTPRAPFVRTAADLDREALGRLDVELYRQREYLEGDARALTASDVSEAITLGEPDLFRALQRLPGVTTRDDFTAELWTRGAPWSHTRVYFDGLPLFNPVHTAGVFTGITPDAVGAAFFLPGGRSAAFGEGAAGILDLTSRPPRGEHLSGSADLSMISARLAFDGPLGSRGGWMAAGRRSYVDLLTALVADSADQIPYALEDVAARADVPLDGGAGLTVSGLVERDVLLGSVPRYLRDGKGHWGNAAVRATITAPAGGIVTRHTFGLSRFAADLTQLQLSLGQGDTVIPSLEATANGITVLLLRGAFEGGGPGRWSLGYEFAARSLSYQGPPPRAYPQATRLDTLTLSVRRSLAALWGERRWFLGPVALQAGLRVEFPGHVANAPVVAAAPRVTARVAAGPTLAFTGTYARAYQYTQTIGAAGPGVGPDLHLSDVWLMADDTVPALRSDLGTLSAEAWLGTEWLGSATLYERRVTGAAVPDPAPGELDADRPLYVSASQRAAGVELSLRRIAGRLTGSLAYSEGLSRVTAGALSYPSSAERRRVIDVAGTLRWSRAWRTGLAFTAASGAPFTRFLASAVALPVACDTLPFCADTTLVTTRAVEAPNANRTPVYLTLDLSSEWRHDFRGWGLSVLLQVRNLLNRRNAVTYEGSRAGTCAPEARDDRPAGPGVEVCDRFHRGIGLVPLVGVSVEF